MSVEKDDEVKPKVIRKRVTKEKVGFTQWESNSI